ncbi:2-nitropropane dioxygenase [Mycena floridula]|nr:2-nitropropane dioxygenase [Mycena floridula]
MPRRIHTALTQALDIDVPIISAPMAGFATPELAAAVTSAGALGLLGADDLSSERLISEARLVRQKLGIPEGDAVPLGRGFIAWVLDITEATPDPRLPAYLDERHKIIWLAFGDNLGKYVKFVRDYEAHHTHKTLVFVMVGTVEQAVQAAEEWNVDFIVTQGTESGGHGNSTAPPLVSLLQAILTALPNGPPIIAAGGLATGTQIAGVLTMGAAGVVMGTRFLFTHECSLSSVKKSMLLKADLGSTTRSVAFDKTYELLGWPDKYDSRAISNDIIRDADEGVHISERRRRFKEACAVEDESRLIVWAGVGAGMTKEIKGAADVVRELHEETVKALELAQSSVAMPHEMRLRDVE